MNDQLLNTYVFEVGRHLAGRNRADIEAEIRSTLQDMLDERSQKTGKAVDEDMTLEVLKEYGSPEKVAATYVGERYLIGPLFYPTFLTVLRIALSVIAVLALVVQGINVSHATVSFQAIFVAILNAVGNFLAIGLTAFGIMVFIFALIERAIAYSGVQIDGLQSPKERLWDPRTLLKTPAASRIKLGETILEIVGACAAIVIFNLYPQIIGFGYAPNGSWYIGAGSSSYTPLLSPAFFHFVPYLTAVWVLTILLDIALLLMGHWSVPTRIAQIGLRILNILIAAAMLAAPSLLAVTAASLTAILGNARSAATLITTLSLGIRILLGLSIFGSAVEIIRALYRLVIIDLASR
jgi:hypothetical protein